jgi:hypothetical protein
LRSTSPRPRDSEGIRGRIVLARNFSSDALRSCPEELWTSRSLELLEKTLVAFLSAIDSLIRQEADLADVPVPIAESASGCVT